MNDTVADYVKRFRNFGLDGTGVTDAQIAELERSSGAVPAAYKAYLLIAGREPPSAWVGSDCTLRHLPDLRKSADELLRENGQPALPANAFVFLMHQGYQFFYFDADDSNDDPPVFYYLEGEPAVIRRFDHFSELVSICAGDTMPDN